MTDTITITRHYSGFRNIADTYRVGDHEYEAHARAAVYRLPEGYVNDEDNGELLDPDGCRCTVVDVDGAPVIMSLTGNCRDVRLVEIPQE